MRPFLLTHQGDETVATKRSVPFLDYEACLKVCKTVFWIEVFLYIILTILKEDIYSLSIFFQWQKGRFQFSTVHLIKYLQKNGWFVMLSLLSTECVFIIETEKKWAQTLIAVHIILSAISTEVQKTIYSAKWMRNVLCKKHLASLPCSY